MSKEAEQSEAVTSRNRTVVLCKWDMEEMFKHATGRKVLIPVDGSEYSRSAFHFYLNTLHRSNDIVILTHTLELPPKPPVPFPDVGKHDKEWKKAVEERRCESRHILGSFIEQWEELMGIDQKQKIIAIHDEHSSPGEGIIAVSKDFNATLIVIGSRGMGFIRRTFLGSVSDYVIHHSDVPVAVIPPADH